MALRRLAQANNAASASGSPRDSTPRSASASASGPSSPVTPGRGLPSTPRNRISYVQSPSATPSISSSTPFDWEAARSMKPAPYGTPLQGKRKLGRKSVGGPGGTPRKAIVRKRGIVERISSIPSQIAFEIGMFPHNIPLPAPQTSAWLLGGDSDLGWEDMYREHEGSSWFDWTTPMTLLLIAASVLNAFYLFSRLRLYRLHRRPDPVSSPNAKFVSADLDYEPLQPPSLISRISSGAWYTFCASWRFLLNMNPPSTKYGGGPTMSKVQQLEVWIPGELEMTLFCIYSPVHPLLWMATTSANWMFMLLIMSGVGVQMRVLTRSYEALVKDKEIIAAEVMHEYNEGFVYPRVNPIRKDVAVMTNQAETVNVWED